MTSPSEVALRHGTRTTDTHTHYAVPNPQIHTTQTRTTYAQYAVSSLFKMTLGHATPTTDMGPTDTGAAVMARASNSSELEPS